MEYLVGTAIAFVVVLVGLIVVLNRQLRRDVNSLVNSKRNGGGL